MTTIDPYAPYTAAPARACIREHLDEAQRALDKARDAVGGEVMFTFLEIAMNEIGATRSAAWDHVCAEGLAGAVVDQLNGCGITHPLLRDMRELTIEVHDDH